MAALTLGIVLSGVNQLQAADYSTKSAVKNAQIYHRPLGVTPIAAADATSFSIIWGVPMARLGYADDCRDVTAHSDQQFLAFVGDRC